MTEVATRKLLENDKVIVWELVLEPGESTGVHRHELRYMVPVIEGSTLRATDGDGGHQVDVTLQPNDTHFFEISDGVATSGGLSTPAIHDAMNVGTGRYREIMVELK